MQAFLSQRTRIARHFESQASVRSTTHRLGVWHFLRGGRKSRMSWMWGSYPYRQGFPERKGPNVEVHHERAEVAQEVGRDGERSLLGQEARRALRA